jgi:hypothetical protein
MNVAHFLVDGTGSPSSMRLVMIVWTIGLLGIWASLCVIRKEMVDIPSGVVTVHGLVIGGKMLQSFSPGDQAK